MAVLQDPLVLLKSALLPKALLLSPLVASWPLLYKARAPTAVLLLPLFHTIAPAPLAVLFAPVVFKISAAAPVAVLSSAVLRASAPAPTPVLKLAVVVLKREYQPKALFARPLLRLLSAF